jgi:type II secretory pathway pseudopilin PulG
MCNQFPSRRSTAFTLIELLVVIAIMIILAGVIVSLTGVVGDKKAISTTRAEIERLSTLIEVYKLKTGFYPPPPDPNLAPNTDPTNTTLFYELTSMELVAPALFSNQQFQVALTGAQLQLACGLARVFNSVRVDPAGDIEDRKVRAYTFLREVSPRQTNTIEFLGQKLIVFVAPVEGPNGRRVNPICYRVGTNAIHNPSSFDLWAVIKTKNGSKIIGNWKD